MRPGKAFFASKRIKWKELIEFASWTCDTNFYSTFIKVKASLPAEKYLRVRVRVRVRVLGKTRGKKEKGPINFESIAKKLELPPSLASIPLASHTVQGEPAAVFTTFPALSYDTTTSTTRYMKQSPHDRLSNRKRIQTNSNKAYGAAGQDKVKSGRRKSI